MVVTRTVRDEEHIRYPCVVFLSLTVTIGGVNKSINNGIYGCLYLVRTPYIFQSFLCNNSNRRLLAFVTITVLATFLHLLSVAVVRKVSN